MRTRRTNKHILWLAGLLLALTFLPTSCKQEADTIVQTQNVKTTTYKIAVVLPISQSEDYKKRMENTVSWALENIRNAQKHLALAGDTSAIDLDIEWHDEDKENLKELGSTLSQRDDIMLVVGPQRNDNVDVMAKAYKKTDDQGYSADGKPDKPLIVPCASSEDIVRKYAVTKSGDKAQKPFLWSLCETDVTQSELLLTSAWEDGAESVALLTPEDSYGKTFYEWAPYQANNLGLSLQSQDNMQYTESNLAEKAREAMRCGADYLICAPENTKDLKTILEARMKAVEESSTGYTPTLLFTNEALSATLSEVSDLAPDWGLQGIAPYADPSTGFLIAYKNRFGYAPSSTEAQVYDAILLSGLAAYMKKHSSIDPEDTNEAIRQMTSTGTETCLAWNELGLRNLMQTIKEGKQAEIMGASGTLRFDSEAYTSLVQSTYVHWMYFENNFIPLEFRTRKGDGHTTASMASWNWVNTEVPELKQEYKKVEYKPLKDKWALLVQASSDWEDYRHQADVLNVYQMLKQNGWDDDHIILIISDNIANNKNNLFQGEVRSRTDGKDLYKTAKIDYSSDSLSTADIKDIIQGKKSQHLPTVLNTSDQSNILLFWSGHGIDAAGNRPNCFYWKSNKQYLSDNDFKEILTNMYENQRYRKMLMLLEPCHSRNIAIQANGLPGILAIASAGGTENAFADYHSPKLGVWMSDRFSNNLVNTLTENPGQTYKELYEYLYRHTLGSHVYVENSYWFDNIFTTSPEEFIKYK